MEINIVDVADLNKILCDLEAEYRRNYHEELMLKDKQRELAEKIRNLRRILMVEV